MRNRILVMTLLVALIAVAFGPAAAQTAQPTAVDAGFIRIAHLAADAPAVDIYAGNGTTPIATNLKFGDVTEFVALPTSLSGFTARAAGSPATSSPVAQANYGVKSNGSNILVVVGLQENKSLAIEPITVVRTDAKGKARVRVISTVSGGPNLSVANKQGVQFSQNQKFLDVSAYQDVEPGTYSFSVTDGTGKTYATVDVTVGANEIVELFVAGRTQGSVTLIPVISKVDFTNVKIVNQAAETFDVYLKGTDQPFTAALGAGQSSAAQQVPSGAVTFVVRKAGGTVKDQELAALAIQLRPYHDTTITITAGANGTPQIVVSEDMLTLAFAPGITSAPAAGTVRATSAATASGTTSAATTSAATLSVTSVSTSAATAAAPIIATLPATAVR